MYLIIVSLNGEEYESDYKVNRVMLANNQLGDIDDVGMSMLSMIQGMQVDWLSIKDVPLNYEFLLIKLKI